MYIVESYEMAVMLSVVTMLFWGSWANTQKLASKKWPFQLFYWDYSIGVLLLTVALAFTLGSYGESGRSFLVDFRQADNSALFSAFLGGVVFNLANILLVAAIDIAGMAVAFPIGIGLALVLGVITNYIAVPVGNPVLIFIGLIAVVVAILLDAFAYKRLPSEEGASNSKRKGIVISVVAGVLMGFFYRFVAASMSVDFENLTPGKLSPYTALVVFSIGLLASSFIWNSIVMIKPFKGEPVAFKDYFIKGDTKTHLIGILGGVIWSIGMSLSILASGKAGFAISYGLGQGATMVAALWGVFIWKEFKEAKEGTNKMLTFMFLFYIVGLTLIIFARIV